MNKLDIGNFLQEEYWGGHSIGIGDMQPPDINRIDLKSALDVSAQQMQFVRQPATEPLRTLYPGEIWNADEYNPGAIILLHEEQLVRTNKVSDDVLSRLRQDKEVPLRETGEQARVNIPPTPGVPLRYKRFTSLGFLATRHDGGQFLWTGDTQDIAASARGERGRASRRDITDPLSFTVGATAHCLVPRRYPWRSNTEVLRRINKLEVLAYGQPARAQRRPSRQHSWAPRFGTY